MADHPVNAVCDERFENLDNAQDETKRTLSEHERMLTQHAQMLSEHSRLLADVKAEQKRQGELLTATQTTLATVSTMVVAIKESLTQLNGWQIKLIFLLAAGVLVLAGVQKLGDLGVF